MGKSLLKKFNKQRDECFNIDENEKNWRIISSLTNRDATAVKITIFLLTVDLGFTWQQEYRVGVLRR